MRDVGTGRKRHKDPTSAAKKRGLHEPSETCNVKRPLMKVGPM